MIQVTDLTLQFGGRKLFEDVNLKFTEGNCYGIIGANGAGKSTFLKVLSGEIEPTRGHVSVGKGQRISVLHQNQNDFDDCTVMRTVLLGHKKLMDIWDEKDALYAKPDFSDEDGVRAGELENEFAELGGWEAESEAASLLNELKFGEEYHDKLMKELDAKQKVKILLAQALFGNPDILILDEPTNNLDAKSVMWLEKFLLDFKNTLIIVSHNRHFLNKVCTHICDVDYGKINMYVGNYDFWYETNQLLQKQAREANKKAEARAKELQDFIARFAANASKSRQATSRKKELEKLTLEDIKPSMRKYPYINFEFSQELGKEVLTVEGLTKKGFFRDVSFTVQKGEKIAFIGERSVEVSMLFDILAGVEKPDSGKIVWGKTVTTGYLPQNFDSFFDGCKLDLVKWIDQWSKEHDETYLRSWLGRMLFSGDEVKKSASVLSGGEKVRCMMARAMLTAGNVLIMDEPTNHLDLEAITALNKGLINYKGCLLFSSHDQELMQTTANRIIEIDGTKTFDKLTTYEDYLEMSD